jgi:hypothetical protein
MVDSNLTYLDSLNRYIVVWSYKALTGLSEKSLVSTKPGEDYGVVAKYILRSMRE